MYSVKILALVVCAGFFSGVIALDFDLRTVHADKLINRCDASGNNRLHRIAQYAQNIDADYGQELLQRLAEEFGETVFKEANPFILNKDGKTPRQIAEEIFYITGSYNARIIALVFQKLEEKWLEIVPSTMRTLGLR